MEDFGGLELWETTFVCANSVTFVCQTKDLRGYIETRNKWQNRDLTLKAWNDVDVYLRGDGFRTLSTILESPSYAHITSLITPEALTNLTMTKKSPKSVPKIQTEPTKPKPASIVNNSPVKPVYTVKPVANPVNNNSNPKTIPNNNPKKESSLINQIGLAMRDKMTKTEEKLFKTDCQSELEQMAFGKLNKNLTNGKKMEAKVEKGKDKNVKSQGSTLQASNRVPNLIFSTSRKVDPKTVIPEKKVEVKVEEKVPEKKAPPKEIIKVEEKKKIEVKKIEIQEEKSKAEKKKEKKQRQKEKKKEVNGDKGCEVESEEEEAKSEEEEKVQIENERSNQSLETLQLECKRLHEKIQKQIEREALEKKQAPLAKTNGTQSSLENSVDEPIMNSTPNSVKNQNAQLKVAKKEKKKEKEKEVVVQEYESSATEEEEEMEEEDKRSEDDIENIEFDEEEVPAFIQKLYHKSGMKNEVKSAKNEVKSAKNQKTTKNQIEKAPPVMHQEEESLKLILQTLKTDKACLDKACEVTMKGRWKVAVACFTKAIELQPFNMGHYLNRCYYHLRTCSYNLALNDASYVIQKSENTRQIALAKFRAGQAWYALKNFDEAEKSILESVELWPDNLIFIRELLYIRMKQLLVMGFSRKSIFEVLYTSHSFSDACNKLTHGKFNSEEDPRLIPVTRESEIYYSDDEDEVDSVDSLTKLTLHHHSNRKKQVSDENRFNNKHLATSNSPQRKKLPPNNILKEPNVKTVPVMKDPVINYKDYEDKCLFLGNLNSSVTTTQIKKKFSCYGKILSVIQPIGVSYAFVNFENPISLKDVLTKEQNCKINDVKITVRPKPKRR